ncbi:MAG TPA: hypothetical protein DCL44_10960 [Elusimicrobia bacterium]|nr:hypothetical protein [Elusimicrobiota bacterium]
MKKGIFITVRTDSSRLPNKALAPILGRPEIEMIMLRARQVKEAEVVVCTTERPVDNGIAALAEKNGIKYFRGSLEDKLLRWKGAAEKFNLDYFVTFDGDDLFCDPELIRLGIEQMEKYGCDFIKAPKGLICGSFTYAIKTSALKKVCEIKDTGDTEMMWVYFEDTGLFKVRELEVEDRVFYSDEIRMTLDYPEDLEFFTRIFEHFNCVNNDTPLREIVIWLNKHPEIIKINSFRQQDFLANQKRKTKLVLKNSAKRVFKRF